MFLKLRNFWKLITFTYQFGNYGLLCVNLLKLRTLFEELWTFTGDFFLNLDLVFDNCGLFYKKSELYWTHFEKFWRVDASNLNCPLFHFFGNMRFSGYSWVMSVLLFVISRKVTIGKSSLTYIWWTTMRTGAQNKMTIYTFPHLPTYYQSHDSQKCFPAVSKS